MTYPLILHLPNAVSDQGDPYLTAWILHWDFHQAFHQPLKLFEANILYPYKHTLAMSENLFGISLVVWPLFALGAGPLLAHGAAEFLGFALSGYAAFRLCRTAFGATGPALVGGVMFAFVPFRLGQLPHLAYVFTPWIPLTLEALILFSRNRTWPRALWLGVSFLMNGLSGVHWLVLTLLPLALAGLLLFLASDRESALGRWLRGVLCLALASLLLFLFLSPYREVARLYRMTRGQSEVAYFSGTPVDWISFPANNRLYGRVRFGTGAPEGGLAPGFLSVLLALAGILLARREEPVSPGLPAPGRVRGIRILDAFIVILLGLASIYAIHGRYRWTVHGVRLLKIADPARILLILTAAIAARLLWRLPFPFRTLRRPSLRAAIRQSRFPIETWIAVAWVAVGVAGSMGMNFFFHRALFDLFSVFRSIRVPTRWCMVSYVGIALLTAAGARGLLRSSERMRRAAPGLVAVLICLLLAEFRAAPLFFHSGETVPPSVYDLLRRTPMRGGIVELPAGNWIWEGPYVLRAAFHEKPLVTAYSGFIPPIQQRIAESWKSLALDERFQQLLEGIPTSYLVIHTQELDGDQLSAVSRFLEEMTSRDRLRLVAAYGPPEAGDLLYAVAATEPPVAGSSAPRSRFPLHDESIPFFFDRPLKDAMVVRGPLWIGGWTRTATGDVDVKVILDGRTVAARPQRYSRPDVHRVFPALGDASKAGFSLTLQPREDLLARHTIVVEGIDPEGRIRRFGPYHLEWAR